MAVEEKVTVNSDWVEIIEPRSRERMYVNLTTGECGWDPPPNLRVRQSDENQWWELFDQNNNRFYYYNAITQQTVWHRPQGCDIVPLARLQAMKRNSQSEFGTSQHRNSTSSEGQNTPIQITLLQDMEKSKDNIGLEKRPETERDTLTGWQPLPGTKAAMLVKVNSLRQVNSSSSNSFQMQNNSEINSQESMNPKAVVYAQSQSMVPNSLTPKSTAPVEMKRSMKIKKTENGGFCLVLTNGHTPQPPSGNQLQKLPACPKYASPPPVYDEPSIDSPIYDEPPIDMDIRVTNMNGTTPQLSPSNSLNKKMQPIKLLQPPSIQQHQGGKKHLRNPSTTEYSPVGKEYIKHMVNIDQSSKKTHSTTMIIDGIDKSQLGQLSSRESFKQSWKVVEANVLKNMEVHNSRQSSLQAQEYPTVISQQDSGYSTGPSPSLRKRKGRRHAPGLGRPGSVGSNSELTVLNDKLIAEMREVVNRSAAYRGSKGSLDAEMLDNTSMPEGNKIKFQSDYFKKCNSRNSRDDLTSSNRSLYRPTMEGKGSLSNDPAIQQDVVRQKRTYEKIDSLEKNVSSLINPSSSDTAQLSTQCGTIGSHSQEENNVQSGTNVGYQFPFHTIRKPISQSSMTDWASKNLNMHTQGIFRRRLSIANMLSWNGGSIKKPMLITSNDTIKKEACEIFKLIQIYMGDRQARMDRNNVALITITKCWSVQGLRDELYIQLIRQTTDNMCYQSLARGWELMAISLAFFSPSPKFQSYLEGYIYRHLSQIADENITQRIKELLDLKNKKSSKSRKKRKQSTEDEGLPISTYARYCYRKLQKVAITGGKKGLRKPTVEEIIHAKNAIVTPSLFGSSLEEIMSRQQDMYPDNKLPWVQTQLSQQVLRLGGEQTEGIFRIPGDIDEVNALKLQVDQWKIPNNLSDPNIPASLLKLWYRELEEPVIPQQFYKECVSNYENPDAAVAVVELLPELNKLVLCYLIHFLQIFAQPINVGKTKMDVNNLAMVMAPNCLRCQSDDPRIIFENTRKEMSFLRMLIVHLDTSFIKGVM